MQEQSTGFEEAADAEFIFHTFSIATMANLTHEDRLALVQHAILAFDTEQILKEKLERVMTRKEVERAVDTLIATQRVRRIGSEKLQNNVSATGELAPLSAELDALLRSL